MERTTPTPLRHLVATGRLKITYSFTICNADKIKYMRKIACYIVLALVPITVSSQTPQTVNAQWLNNNVDKLTMGGANIIHNNLFTGTADITIPFFSYADKGISLDVNAGYNTSGIKVDDIASDIGLGWELN